ncbi:MAG TPA: hypothetical protein EYN92_02860 [Dehalococcoidia bacterium]|nr:hypothetical protein [Dehalococcoidia bacterium]
MKSRITEAQIWERPIKSLSVVWCSISSGLVSRIIVGAIFSRKQSIEIEGLSVMLLTTSQQPYKP